MTFFEFNTKFATEQDVINYFVHIRYGKTLVCPHCKAAIRVGRRYDQPKLCNCNNCNNTFSVFTGTIFEHSPTDLRKWFFAIHLFLNGKKGISGLQLKREIGVTYKCAWRMLQQIRIAMGNVETAKAFEGLVEIDEAYVGGKPRKQNKQTQTVTNKRGRGTNKTPVVGMKERDTKKVVAHVALPNEKGQKLSGKQLLKYIEEACKDGSTIISDDFVGYKILDRTKNYLHFSVNHSIGEFSNGNGVHTNGIESFWALLKRGVYGVYHHISTAYLQRYVDEFCFRQNNRKNPKAFDVVLKQALMPVFA